MRRYFFYTPDSQAQFSRFQDGAEICFSDLRGMDLGPLKARGIQFYGCALDETALPPVLQMIEPIVMGGSTATDSYNAVLAFQLYLLSEEFKSVERGLAERWVEAFLSLLRLGKYKFEVMEFWKAAQGQEELADLVELASARLISKLDDAVPEERFLGVAAAFYFSSEDGGWADQISIPHLVEAIAFPDAPTQDYAKSLVHLLMREWSSDDRSSTLVEALKPVLARNLASGDENSILVALDLLKKPQFYGSDGITSIPALLNHPTKDIRDAAALAIIRSHPDSAYRVELLVGPRLSRNVRTQVRKHSAFYLTDEYGDPLWTAAEVLNMLTSVNEAELLDGLGRAVYVEHAALVPVLMKFTQVASDPIRLAAWQALSYVGSIIPNSQQAKEIAALSELPIADAYQEDLEALMSRVPA